MIDILYLAHGRPEFTKVSLKTLIENTQLRYPYSRLHVYTDGDLMPELCGEEDCIFSVDVDRHGGPVACMNHLVQKTSGEFVAKIDNDTMVSPGWLDECACSIKNAVSLLGIEAWTPDVTVFPNFTAPVVEIPGVRLRLSRHVGGIGVFRRSVFEKYGLPKPNSADGRYGFTEWQWANPGMIKAFLNPPLPVFLLDHLPMEPWRSLSAKYEAEGIQRRQWGFYDAEKHKALWEWWKP